jgi:hypothetical protein
MDQSTLDGHTDYSTIARTESNEPVLATPPPVINLLDEPLDDYEAVSLPPPMSALSLYEDVVIGKVQAKTRRGGNDEDARDVGRGSISPVSVPLPLSPALSVSGWRSLAQEVINIMDDETDCIAMNSQRGEGERHGAAGMAVEGGALERSTSALCP